MKSELGLALMHALSNNHKTQTWLADKAGLTQPSLNHLINNGARPKKENLAPICHAFARQDGLDVLCGHLRDEILASGYRRTEISLGTHPELSDSELDHAVDELRAIAGQRRDVAQLLLDLAALCEELPSKRQLLAADDDKTRTNNTPRKPIKYPTSRRKNKT